MKTAQEVLPQLTREELHAQQILKKSQAEKTCSTKVSEWFFKATDYDKKWAFINMQKINQLLIKAAEYTQLTEQSYKNRQIWCENRFNLTDRMACYKVLNAARTGPADFQTFKAQSYT